MRRILGWSLAVVAVGLLAPARAPAAEPAPAVEEWQVRGVLAALKDGYPQVRALAAVELADLLKPDAPGAGPREWRGQSQTLLREAQAELRELLKEPNADIRVDAARALTRLCERTQDASALRELLREPESGAGWFAAEALARLHEGSKDVPALRELLRDSDANVAWYAAQSLARVYEEAKDAAALRALLGDPDRNARWYAGQALARLYERAGDLSALRELLKDANPDVRREAAQALARSGGKDAAPTLRDVVRNRDANPDARRESAEALARLGEKDAVPVLHDLLKDPRPGPREKAAEALARVHERGKDVPALRELLKDASAEARDRAAQALVRLYTAAKDAPALRELLKDANRSVRREAAEALAQLHRSAKDEAGLREMLGSPDPDVYREAAGALVQVYEAKKDAAALRDIIQGPDPYAAREAAWALGRLGEKDAAPALRDLLKDPNPEARRETTDVLTRLGETDLPAVLRIPYEDTSYLYWARWQAHSWGGRDPDVARVLCAYLGRPKDDPTPPVSGGRGQGRRENVLNDVRVLREQAWQKTDSPWLKEDVARTWSWLITQEVTDLHTAGEVDELKKVRDALKDGPGGRRYLAGIDRVLEPYEISPSPFVRTWIVFALLNVVAFALGALVVPRLRGRGRWLPLGAYVAGLVAVSLADVGGWEYRAHAIPWLLAAISLAWFGLMGVAVTVSPQPALIMLRGLGLRGALRPGGRRQVLDHYATLVGGRLRDARDRAAYEEYTCLPAAVRSDRELAATSCADPAAEILALLTGAQGRKGSVLIEAPGGRGKSALVREVVARALDGFKKDPGRQPLPVLLTGGHAAVETLIETALKPLLPFPELIPTYLAAGTFFLVLDGVSESGPAAEVLANFAKGPHGRTTPLLLAARPGRAYETAIRGTHWMTVEPTALDEEQLRAFVSHYGGSAPAESVNSACRGPDGGYLPSLVRMALVVNLRGDGPVSAADAYREFFLKSLEGQLPAPAERVKRLEEASRWCLETYWRDGQRRCRYDPADVMQRQLRQAGLLAAADSEAEPKEVLFADATMQSYLTAHGLAAQDRQGYKQLPRPKDDPGTTPWDRGRVLLRAAAEPRFAGDPELFRMCLATFTPKTDLRQWLFDELTGWAGRYEEDLPRRRVLAVVPGPLAERVRDVRGGANLLTEAARLAFEADAARDAVEMLGRLYAGVAPLAYDLECGPTQASPLTI